LSKEGVKKEIKLMPLLLSKEGLGLDFECGWVLILDFGYYLGQ